MNDILLEVTNLSKYFNGRKGTMIKAVNGISFTIAKGQTLGLVGESGCGKTTVARLLTRLYKPESGTITFDGKDIHRLEKQEKREICKKIQMVFQDPTNALNPEMIIMDIIADGLQIHRVCSRHEERENVYNLLNLVGLDERYAWMFPHQLSGGQKQRVGIARALALEPQLLVCDEILSALDIPTQCQIMNLLLDIQRTKGVSYLFISHDLNMVRHIADEVAVMYSGQIIEFGTTQEIYNNPSHPYTQKIMAACALEGNPSFSVCMDNSVVSRGCNYYNNCPRSSENCLIAQPIRIDVNSNHYILCSETQNR